MYVCGIDENGLGPKLGPLVVTGVLLEAPDYDPRVLRRRLGAALRRLPGGAGRGVADSKEILGFDRMAAGEPVVLGLLAAALGTVPATFRDLFRRLALLPESDLQSECPPGAFPMCWLPELELPLWSETQDSAAWRDALARGGAAAAAALAQAGVHLLDVAVGTSCPGWFNRDLGAGRFRNKLHLEFALIEAILARFRARSGARLQAYCGRLGGTRTAYPEFFERLRDDRCDGPFLQDRCVTYVFDGLGDLSFVDDAESAHPPVALASMVGKYVREAFMERLNRFFRADAPDLRPTSGYHNPVTAAFVDGTRARRQRTAIPDGCFTRQR